MRLEGRAVGGAKRWRGPDTEAPIPIAGDQSVEMETDSDTGRLLQQVQQVTYQSGGIYGGMGGSNFSSSPNAVSLPLPPGNFRDLPHQHCSPQLREEHRNKGHDREQHVQDPVHQTYLQYPSQAAQQKSHGNMPAEQRSRTGMVGPSWRGQDMLVNNLKMQDLMSLQAANQTYVSISKESAQNIANNKRHMEQGNDLADQRHDMAQFQAMQTWTQEHNGDHSLPADVNLIAQVLPLWQSARMAEMMKPKETRTISHQSYLPPLEQQLMPSPAGSENSAPGNSLSGVLGQAGPVKSWKTLPSGSICSDVSTTASSSTDNRMQQHQLTAHSRENQNEKVGRFASAIGNGLPIMHFPQSSGGMCQILEHSDSTTAFNESGAQKMQHFEHLQQLTVPPSQHVIPSSEGVNDRLLSQGGKAQMTRQCIGFTRHQLYVLKAQILAFRRLKRGERALPHEVLQAIAPPPLDSQSFLPSGMIDEERPALNSGEEHARYAETMISQRTSPLSKGHDLIKDESFIGEEKAGIISQVQGTLASSKEPVQVEPVGKVDQNIADSLKSDPEFERESRKISTKVDLSNYEAKAVPLHSATVDSGQVKKPVPTSTTIFPKDVATRKYHGPLFDFQSFTRKHDSLGSTNANYSSTLTLAYDGKELLLEEGMDVLNKKRTENLKKISGLIAVNLERKRVSPDIVLRLQIEQKKLRLLDLQARLRDEVDQQQQEIMEMSDRPYRKFVRLCEHQRIEFKRQVQLLQKVSREKQLKSIFQWRKKLLEAHWGIRDARLARNRGVAKYHERMLREFSKRKDGDRNKRMEALKNNDVDRYREMLLEQQTNVPGDASQRYTVLASFLSQTEEYLHKLGGKITAAKNYQEVEEAANAASAAARSQGLSEEEVKAAATCAREEVMIRNRFSEMNTPKGNSSVNKYYNLAHAVNERVVRQPSMLRAGTLRDYQLVGLQWMLSLYNNKLNGILADEMGLGKTVQVMALIAYLMEFKGNYGPHLIIVPNAVLVNWKSELLNWLPSLSCIFYVGSKDQRSKLFSHVQALKFNVLVTTYEFVMFDRSKLSKIEWKYIIIDEAQRMKDRDSVLARDLDRYRCHRRLLLTGTPLQNDLRELWSLLNLLLPEVFDNSKAFHEWFSKPFQKDGPSHSPEEDDWLETEKKVIIIHRLHQILEPFMLRRRVEDVEGSLPPKVPVVLRCRMSAIQSAIYDWIKSTGTIRVDPEEELQRVEKNPMYQVKVYKNLNNKCMELRKLCNHPLLNYPYFNDFSKEFIVRSCGKLWILDRILIKLQRAGHRVLLFSTMTKLLDILEEYLQWRRLIYRRIDGTTSLEDRESAIMDFNSPDSDCFIFLLSIRAAGRGLNLQSADTVVIYDPDPNPQNEEQAVARAHRIGQKREVKVIYMEAVVDKISSYQKEDELKNGGTEDSEDDLAGKDRYVGSIESLIRSNIQQYKLDMADEVINAGRFDQRTTHEERRTTLETLLHDEERYQETLHDVPSLQEVNRLIARSEEEIDLFDKMDEEFDWTREMVKYNQVPKWLRAGSREVNALVGNMSKKSSKNILANKTGVGSGEILSCQSPSKTERRGQPKGSTIAKEYPNYRGFDDQGDESDSSSKRDASFLHEEEEEIGDFDDEESNGAIDMVSNNKGQLEEEGRVCDGGGYEFSRVAEGSRSVHLFEVAGSTGSSAGSQRSPHPASLSVSSQKFGSLSTLDAIRPIPNSLSKSTPDELEEGEIAVSGNSHMDIQRLGSCVHDRDDGEDEQVQQPKIKRKRSIRVRPRYNVGRLEAKSNNEWVLSQRGSQGPLRGGRDCGMQLRTDPEPDTFREAGLDRHDMNTSSLKQRCNLPLRKVSPVVKQNTGRTSYMSESAEDASEHSRGSWNQAQSTGVPGVHGTKMSDSTQRKCKNVISKLQRRIDKEGHQIVPILYGFWKRTMNSTFASPVGMASNLLDLQRIEQNVDNLEYSNVTDLITDVQLMLKTAVRQFNYSHEVRHEAGKLQDLFFDIMKIAFPEADFRGARNAATFSSPGGSATAPSLNQTATSQCRQRTPMTEPEPNPSPTEDASPGPTPVSEEGRTRAHSSRLRQESAPAGGIARGQVLPERSPLLAHLGDLVVRKKKRKERDKSAAKQRSSGPLSPSDPIRAAPVSPPLSTGRSGGVRFQKDAHPTQQHGGEAGRPFVLGGVRWATPVKKMRTDSGRRRPGHL